jgi:hypothetical protein
MDERFLHFIWKFQKLKGALKTTDGQALTVLSQGNHNHNSGPDFEEARIKIGNVEWAGNVEVHVKSSDWNKHNHQNNRAFDNVILHVVWVNDQQIFLNEEPIPTIELNDLVEKDHHEKYARFMNNHEEILCATQLGKVSELSFTNLQDRMMIERLEQKANEITNLLTINGNDWEATTYQILARNFGFSVNKEPFIELAASLPYKVVAKYSDQVKCIEALIFGQAGFLEDEVDNDYHIALKNEYQYLQKKHTIQPKLKRSMWKFSKMRPSNFPTVRLAQYSALLSKNKHLFSLLTGIHDPKKLIQSFQFDVSGYWQKHYDFGKLRKKISGNIGESTINNILINSIAPLLAVYGRFIQDQQYIDRSINILEMLPPEKNHITRKWESVGKSSKSAFDSQSLIGLYKNYCTQKKCLLCSVGVGILSR